MGRKKNNKGFSLVELLAAIVIMGILSGIAVVGVTFLLNKAGREYYKAQESEVIMAAKSYTQDNRSFLPKRVGQKNQIYLKTLQNKKYIGDVLDRNKKKCDPDRSYVQVYRYNKNNYSYVVNLVCDKYTSEGRNPTNLVGPDIKFVFSGIGANDNYDLAKVTVTIEDEDKISGYRYIISKSGNEIKNSGDIDGKLEKKVTFTIPLKEFVPGTVEVKVIATDFYGNESTKKETKTIKNSKAPTCTVLKANTTWTNKPPVEVQVKCIDYTGLGCKKDVYTQLFYTEAKIGLVEMEDNAGNKGECSTNTYIDLTPPSTPVIKNTYENKWTNKKYTVQVTSVDSTSGIAYFEYRYPNSVGKDGSGNPENEWHRYKNSSKEPGDNTPFVTTAFSKERDEYVEIRACDRAGNCSGSGRSMIKIDKTRPTCTITRNKANPDGLNDWYKTKVTLTLSTTNPKGTSDRAVASGISYGLKNSNSASYNGVTTNTQSDTAGIIWYGFVKDEAGNKSTCNSGSFKVDTTAPTCSISKSGTAGSDNWYRSSVSLSLSRSDNMSGVASYGLTSSSSTTYNSKSSASRSGETGSSKVSWYGYVKDNAGNTNNCSTTFGIDKTDPIVTTDSVSESTTWCSGAKRISISCSDSGSGISSSQIKDMGTTSSSSDILSSPRNGAATIYTCTDKAGNSSSKVKNFIVVKKTCTNYTRYYEKCGTTTQNCKKEATAVLCSYFGNKATCERYSSCTWSTWPFQGASCGGKKITDNPVAYYKCDSYWTLSGTSCIRTTQTCPNGTFSSYNYGFTSKVAYNQSSCYINSSFTCNSRYNNSEYTTSCDCKSWNCRE